ncbi:zf-HC2 domain-containing protein [bacterium]|nr:MAG: zf-HC2 domain-containing protein [bacterium]
MANRKQVPEIAASTCRHVHRLIVERFDRELCPDEENRVDLHIAACHDCLVFYDQLTLIHKAMEALRQGLAG